MWGKGGGGKTHLKEEPHVSFEIQKIRKSSLMYEMASKVKSP